MRKLRPYLLLAFLLGFIVAVLTLLIIGPHEFAKPFMGIR